MKTLALFVWCLFALPAHSSAAHRAAGKGPEVRVYVLDCGGAEFKDLAAVSDTGEYDGRRGHLVDPCFLIRHPRGTLLWDAGMPMSFPDDQKTAFARMGVTLSESYSIAAQLQRLSLTVAEVDFIAFSHLHFDHVGNANLFTTATWILNRDELEWALAEPAHISMSPALFDGYKRANTKMINGDYDVFGDDSVQILKMPGHTPGSSALFVTLASGRHLLLSGDLYLFEDGRHRHVVPRVNADRAATLASMDRFEKIARNTRAQVIVQHDPADFRQLPKPPDYLR